MDLSQIVQVGKVSEKTFVVGDEHTAKHIGSGSQRVLATPWMITFMERTARDFLVECLPGGYQCRRACRCAPPGALAGGQPGASAG